jgi:hypothetical protein
MRDMIESLVSIKGILDLLAFLFCQSSDWLPVKGPLVGHKKILKSAARQIDNSAILPIGAQVVENPRGFH